MKENILVGYRGRVTGDCTDLTPLFAGVQLLLRDKFMLTFGKQVSLYKSQPQHVDSATVGIYLDAASTSGRDKAPRAPLISTQQ